MRAPGRAIALIMLLAVNAMFVGLAQAGDWNVGLKRLTLRNPVGSGATTGFVTYPTTAGPRSLTIGRFSMMAAEDAAPATGRFPLVIVSHGTGALPDVYRWLFEGLTTRGFVVAGIAHPGDNYDDRSGSFGDALLVDRPRHISALIDVLEADALLASAIDTGKIGIVGHSAGGYAGILSAGGAPDFSQLSTGRCRRTGQDPRWPRLTHDPARSPVSDGRIRAVAAMAPALGCLFDKDSLSAVRIPIRLYQADDDEVLQPGFNATYFSPLFAGAPETVRIAGAGHFVFLDTCSLITRLVAREICTDPSGTNRDEVHRRLLDDVTLFLTQALGVERPR